MAKKLTGGEIVCEALLNEGVELVFGLPGGAILPLYGVLGRYPQLRHVLVRHEQGAAHAADGFSRASGKVGCSDRNVRTGCYEPDHRTCNGDDGLCFPWSRLLAK